jgi:ubiquinone/menaquinone biosynthesis C-methylase UbiE
MNRQRGLSHADTVRFYNRFGKKQDRQGYYEDAALAELVHAAQFERAGSVVEFGCGTGRFADFLLANILPPAASYHAWDASEAMVDLASRRLQPFGTRAKVGLSTDITTLALPDAYADRFISNYVLDILSFEEIAAVINEARRILQPGGLLCLTSLTFGRGWFSKAWTAFWQARFILQPRWVGGCRPIALGGFFDGWQVVHQTVVTVGGISSEVVVAQRH